MQHSTPSDFTLADQSFSAGEMSQFKPNWGKLWGKFTNLTGVKQTCRQGDRRGGGQILIWGVGGENSERRTREEKKRGGEGRAGG